MILALGASATAQAPARAEADARKSDAIRVQIDTDAIQEAVREKIETMRSQPFYAKGRFGADLGFAYAQARGKSHTDSGDRAYERGQRALDSRNWDEALEMFTQVANGGGSRADGALYWKAYTLGKLGKRDDGLAAIAALRKSYTTSRWLDDAKALELELKQAGGQKMSPEAESDEDLKLMAINGLMQSDQERALPLLENLLKTSSSPKLKERALFVLAQSNTPRGKQVLEQVARGSAGNPDLQLKALSYVSASGKKGGNQQQQLLWEVYSASGDNQVKRAALRGLMSARDKDHLLQIARTEKSQPLRMEAIAYLGSSGAQVELTQLYQTETSPELKDQILHSLISGGSSDRLLEIAKSEKDPKLRRSAIRALGSMGATKTGDALVSMYGSETDPAVKRSIMDGLHSQRNAKAMVDLARKENDPAMKREIVSRLSNMKSKEATDYLLELLK
jgi:HEAT repeat protein